MVSQFLALHDEQQTRRHSKRIAVWLLLRRAEEDGHDIIEGNVMATTFMFIAAAETTECLEMGWLT